MCTVATSNYQSQLNDLERYGHSSRSYTKSAIITLVLYWIGFYIVGLIANIIFLRSANRSKDIIGYNPPGRGLLLAMFWIHLVLVVVAGVILLV